MNLKEKLRRTNPNDFRPVEKCVEIIVALHEHGIYAIPSGQMAHIENTDYFELRLHPKGRINDMDLLIFSFEGKQLTVIGSDSLMTRKNLKTIGLCLGEKLSDAEIAASKTKTRPQRHRITFLI